MEQVVDNYAAVFAHCTCGCNETGWFVISRDGWRSHYAVNPVAAGTAVCMLNEGRISEHEVDVMWSAQRDWDVVDVPDDDQYVTPPHLN